MVAEDADSRCRSESTNSILLHFLRHLMAVIMFFRRNNLCLIIFIFISDMFIFENLNFLKKYENLCWVIK